MRVKSWVSFGTKSELKLLTETQSTLYCGLVKLYICMQGFQLWDGMVLGNLSARSY